MIFELVAAAEDDAPAIAALHAAVAERLTRDYGRGPWSRVPSDKALLQAIRTSRVCVVRDQIGILATLRLATMKPWAIDRTYFTDVPRPLYLLAMAVQPGFQRQGVGRQCLAQAERMAREWPAHAIRLDAYDAPAGAGPFYAKCGFREVGRVTFRRTPLVYYERVLIS
jgi:GNAT superfamily N-acetyltransferase